MTVANTLGAAPYSYYHVTPLGIAYDRSGNPFYAIRADYLTLWNADGGLIGGGAGCFYSYFGLDNAINALTSHDLDAERSVMLLAAPAVNGGINPNVNAYGIYTLYTAAHEGTFFDQSEYLDFSSPVPAGNHAQLTLSLSKHSTYAFNPNFYPITPAWFIVATNEALLDAYLAGYLNIIEYSIIAAAADATFFGCLVERFGDTGGHFPSARTNVGEVSHPINNSHFIQDNSSRALNLSDKLTNPVF